MVLAVAGLSSVAFAQNTAGYDNVSGDKYEVLTNKFGGNWFISIGGGGSFLMTDDDKQVDFKDRISPTVNFAIGKWFTPGLGLRLQYSGLQAKGATRVLNDAYATGNRMDNGHFKQDFKYMNVHGDVMFNLSALFAGYNPDRVYEIIPYLGAGFTHNYTSPSRQAWAMNFGIINKFRLSPSLDLNIELSLMGAEDKFDGVIGGSGIESYDGVVSATAGLTYKFSAGREFRRPEPARQLISESELRNIRARMNDMVAENQNLRQQLAAKPAVVEEKVVVEDPNIAPRSVFFKIGSAKISAQELMNLGFMADQIKDYPNMRFRVTGYADSKTGSAQRNQTLSEQRAQAVVDAFASEYNVSRDRFTTRGVGGVDKFDKIYLNRMALIEVVQ